MTEFVGSVALAVELIDFLIGSKEILLCFWF